MFVISFCFFVIWNEEPESSDYIILKLYVYAMRWRVNILNFDLVF